MGANQSQIKYGLRVTPKGRDAISNGDRVYIAVSCYCLNVRGVTITGARGWEEEMREQLLPLGQYAYYAVVENWLESVFTVFTVDVNLIDFVETLIIDEHPELSGLTADQVAGLIFVEPEDGEDGEDDTVKTVMVIAVGEKKPVSDPEGKTTGSVSLTLIGDRKGTEVIVCFPDPPSQPLGPNGETKTPIQLLPENVLRRGLMEELKKTARRKMTEELFNRAFAVVAARHPTFDPDTVEGVRQKLYSVSFPEAREPTEPTEPTGIKGLDY